MRQDPSPRYHQVYVSVRTWVRDGTYGPGAQIPTERELCATFSVSRITVRKAIDELVREGWLVREQGRGTFVALTAARQPTSASLREAQNQVADLGAATRVADARTQDCDPDEETRAALTLAEGERVQMARHVRLLGEVALGVITTYVPLDIAAQVGRSAEGRNEPMFELLDRAGIRIGGAEQWLGATLANMETARALGVEVGAPIVRLTRIVHDVAGRPVERMVALYRADVYHYRMRLEPPRAARKRERDG